MRKSLGSFNVLSVRSELSSLINSLPLREFEPRAENIEISFSVAVIIVKRNFHRASQNIDKEIL